MTNSNVTDPLFPLAVPVIVAYSVPLIELGAVYTVVVEGPAVDKDPGDPGLRLHVTGCDAVIVSVKLAYTQLLAAVIVSAAVVVIESAWVAVRPPASVTFTVKL